MKNASPATGPNARIEEATRYVELLSAELDRELEAFLLAHERIRQLFAGHLLRLRVLGIRSGDPERAAAEAKLFEAAFRDTIRLATEMCHESVRRRTGQSKEQP